VLGATRLGSAPTTISRESVATQGKTAIVRASPTKRPGLGIATEATQIARESGAGGCRGRTASNAVVPEQIQGWLGQYMPTDIDLSGYSEHQLNAIAQ
jgi:hypothetical protein